MRSCYFRARAPKVEVRGSLIFITPDDADHEVALEPRVAGKFVAALNRALDQIYDRSNVVAIRADG